MTQSATDVVGRERELAALGEFVGSISAPKALLLEGEAGIGKTTLWTRGVADGTDRGLRVLTSRPAEAEIELGFAGLADLFGEVAAAALPGLPEPQRYALEVALLLADPSERRPDRRAVAAATLGVLRIAARERAVLVAVDDVQWLDVATQSVLAFVVRRLQGSPVGFLLARRSGGERGPLLDCLLADLPARHIRLGALTPRAVDEILVHLHDGGVLTRPALRRLCEASGGNPLFALELARAVEDAGRYLTPDELPVPESLYDVIDGRLRALPAGVARALPVVAALGAAAVSLLDAVGVSGRALQLALDAGVLETEGEQVRFSHPLLASAAYGALDPRARRRLHRRLAAVVSDPEQRARHLALATERPSEAVAAALDHAAARADARGAPINAAALAEWARRLTPASRHRGALARALRAAQYHVAAGDTNRARELLRDVIAVTARGSLRAEALWWLATVSYREGGWRDAASLFEQAVRVPGGGTRQRALALCDLAWVQHMSGGSEEAALAHAVEALDLAVGIGDRAVESRAAAMVAVHELLAHGVLRPALLERALVLEDPLDAMPAERRPSFIEATILSWVGDLEGSRARMDALVIRARERGDDGSLPLLLAQLAVVECRLGNWGRARELADEGDVIAVQTGQEAMRPATLGVQALLDACAGEVGRACERAEQGLRLAITAGVAPGIGFNVAVLGFLDLSLGRYEAAADRLSELAAALVAADLPDFGASQVVPNAIEALIGLGRLEEAETLLVPLEAQATALTGPLQRATRARCRALLVAARGDPEEAIERLGVAMEEHSRTQEPFERARTLLALGAMQRRAKRRRAARESLGHALEVFEQLGAPLWTAKARGELARIGGRAASSGGLTVTESRVALLVAQGRSNKDVAAALFITPRTVEGHLTKIYGKLRVHSRAELAHQLASAAPVVVEPDGVVQRGLGGAEAPAG